MSVTVYGASDDLIEIEGDIDEEFTLATTNDRDLLAFSNGVVVGIEFTSAGVWRIRPIVVPATASLQVDQAPEGDDENYSDRATVSDASWVMQGIAIAQAERTGDVAQGSRT